MPSFGDQSWRPSLVVVRVSSSRCDSGGLENVASRAARAAELLNTGETPTASVNCRYVAIDATTTRASTVTRSMPTRESRIHASMTIPLSRTRSRTSIGLLLPEARSMLIAIPFAGVTRAARSRGCVVFLPLQTPHVLNEHAQRLCGSAKDRETY